MHPLHPLVRERYVRVPLLIRELHMFVLLLSLAGLSAIVNVSGFVLYFRACLKASNTFMSLF